MSITIFTVEITRTSACYIVVMFHFPMIKRYSILLLVWLTLSCSTKQTANNEQIPRDTLEEPEETAGPVSNFEANKEDELLTEPTIEADTAQMSKAEKLIWLHDRTVQLQGEERRTFESLFLQEFPNSFEEYRKLYGFDMDTGAAPLYENIDHIGLFASLEKVNKTEYYNKYLNISVNGTWEADNIQDFGVYRYMISDPEIMLEVMDERSDEEIISIMRFVFDGPHPDNSQDEFDTLISVIKPFNKRIAKLTTKSFKQLLSEHDGHGH